MSWKPRLNAHTFDRLPGIGRVRAYDNGGETADRYIVLFEDMPDPDLLPETKVRPYGPRHSLSMSGSPSHPQGVSMWGGANPGPWLGRRVYFSELPLNVQQHAIARATQED
jgi:hypothetical protein